MIPRKELPPGVDPRTGYRVSNRVEPSQLRSRLPLAPDAGHSQHAYYRPTATHGEWRGSANGRWRERAILFGLWLLIMLVAIAIGLRFLEETDPSTMRSVRAEALAGLDSLPARTPSIVRPDFAAADDGFDDPLPEAARRGAPAAAAAVTTAVATQERPSTPAAIREALATARSAREGMADAMEPRPETVRTRPAPLLPNVEPGSPMTPTRPAMAGQMRDAGADAAASLAQAASPARRVPELRGAAAITETAEQKRTPACSEALQAMQLCNVAVR
jgi:hypothetical protein